MDLEDVESLREEVTCPVCLEIPLEGELLRCPNGHLICDADYIKLPFPKICPECRANYGHVGQAHTVIPSGAMKCKLANKILAMVSIKCRFSDKGCTVEHQRDKLKVHEASCHHRYIACRFSDQGCKCLLEEHELARHESDCSFEPKVCKYAAYGCPEKVIKVLLESHEDICEWKPYPCAIIFCEQRIPLRDFMSHVTLCHPTTKIKKAVKKDNNPDMFIVDFPAVKTSQCNLFQGFFAEFEGTHFYFGLHQWLVDGTYLISATLCGAQETAEKYRLRMTAINHTKKGNHMTYSGPVNSLEALASRNFRSELVGMNFPEKIATGLIKKHASLNKNVMSINYTILRMETFKSTN